MPITSYYRKLKTLANALNDVCQPTSDETLVLTTLRSLNNYYFTIADLLLMQVLSVVHSNQIITPNRGVLACKHIQKSCCFICCWILNSQYHQQLQQLHVLFCSRWSWLSSIIN
ncbi:hypothetical protein Scep_006513 [Stephania cephalantha]|uniref:Uncharacterized protein n=1 Tax=Stephania cephalantha TaxID=152367 RepID=A0AAP0K858_9MAGN